MKRSRTCGIVCVLVGASFVYAGNKDVAWDPAVSKAIDARIHAKLAKESIKPVAQADDHELLRRIYLDLIGRIPTREETASFLKDRSANKHHKLIDALLVHEEMAVHWRGVINRWLNGMLPERPAFEDKFLAYLQSSLEQNKPWDQMARELLSPDYKDEKQLAASMFIGSRMKGDKQKRLDNITTSVASVFFGVQLQCAKCHDHPTVVNWTQDHYYGLAAFFSRTEEFKYKNQTVLSERADGELAFVTTLKEDRQAKLMFLDGKVIEEPDFGKNDKDRYVNVKGAGGKPGIPKFSRRDALVKYAIDGRSPYFQRAIVNRIWKKLMGRGLVEPVDQMHAENPATHPELLGLLADDTRKNNFNLRRLISAIMHSEAYLRSTKWTSDNKRPGDELYATAVLKPLTPDQMAHSVTLATGYLDDLKAKYEREKQKRKLKDVTLGITRVLYERDRQFQSFVARFESDGGRFQANASQALFLTYNGEMERMLRPTKDSLIVRLTNLKADAAVREAFLAILSREPDQDELDVFEALVNMDSDKNATELQQACRDLIWTLVSSSEFRFNH